MIEQSVSPHVQTAIAAAPIPKFTPELSEDQARDQARLMKALSDPTRLRILSLLIRYPDTMTVYDIVCCFTLEQPSISHHLRVLREAQLIDFRKRSLHVYYYVRRSRLNEVWQNVRALDPLDSVE
jgi:ArsR family transcriptional regulator